MLPATIVEALVSLPNQLAEQAAQIADLQSAKIRQQIRIEFLESQRFKVDMIWLVVAAFIAGLIVGLAVWWFQ